MIDDTDLHVRYFKFMTIGLSSFGFVHVRRDQVIFEFTGLNRLRLYFLIPSPFQ